MLNTTFFHTCTPWVFEYDFRYQIIFDHLIFEHQVFIEGVRIIQFGPVLKLLVRN